MANKLTLDRDRVDACRDLSLAVVRPVQKYVQLHSTVAVERATLRLLGVEDVKDTSRRRSTSLVNEVVDRIDRHKLALGVSFLIGIVKLDHPEWSVSDIAEKVALGEIDLNTLPEVPADKVRYSLAEEAKQSLQRLEKTRRNRERGRDVKPWAQDPLKVLPIATGTVYEDVVQARQAAYAGVDAIGVTRASAQSLLDYVPWGATTEGYAGTYFTSENCRLMRDALDDVSKEVKRYVRFSANGSGLCMPEIAAIAAVEGVDMLSADPLYGVVFRDINMKRAFIDQYVARLILGKAGMMVSTEEDRLFTVMDSFEACPQALASHFINECLAAASGMRDERVSLAFTFSMDPSSEDSLLYEMAMAQLVRDLFPRSPIRFVPPTHYKSGDLLDSHALDSFFTLVGSLTKQGMIELGSPGDGHFGQTRQALQDRLSALKSARYVLSATRSLAPDMVFRANGVMTRRARTIFENANRYLSKIKDLGLMGALEKGVFAGMPREKNSGKGLDGVFQKSRIYYNPCLDLMEKKGGYI